MSTSTQLKYIPWKNVEHEQLNPLIGREMVVGDKIMLARVFLKKGAHVPMHHHHHEQVTYILEAALQFAIDGKELIRRARDASSIPSSRPPPSWPTAQTPGPDDISH